MDLETITCPKCGDRINEISEYHSMAAEIRARTFHSKPKPIKPFYRLTCKCGWWSDQYFHLTKEK